MFRRRQKQVVITDDARITELLTRGVDEIITEDSLAGKLHSGRQLRVKLGVDPTSPHLHLGRSVPLLKLRDFQELGHQVIFIVGDFTGVIGDTSDKDGERPMLSPEEVKHNQQTYFEQVGKLIDLDKAEFRYNSEWLGKLTYHDIGEQADQFSVTDFIARENIKRRLEAGTRISLREVLYPLMQGYDSVAVNADIEIGGVDQRFNLLAGRTLQRHFGQEPQEVIMTTFPVLGFDGKKMSSSWGNTINFSDTPNDMYGKVMRVHDELIETYLYTLTRMPLEEVVVLVDAMKDGNPRDVKMRLAREVVTLYHNKEVAQRAEEQFIETFSEGGLPDTIEKLSVHSGSLLRDILVEHGIVPSHSQARRLITEGALSYPEKNTTVSDPNEKITETAIVKVGKHRFVKLVV